MKYFFYIILIYNSAFAVFDLQKFGDNLYYSSYSSCIPNYSENFCVRCDVCKWNTKECTTIYYKGCEDTAVVYIDENNNEYTLDDEVNYLDSTCVDGFDKVDNRCYEQPTSDTKFDGSLCSSAQNSYNFVNFSCKDKGGVSSYSLTLDDNGCYNSPTVGCVDDTSIGIMSITSIWEDYASTNNIDPNTYEPISNNTDTTDTTTDNSNDTTTDNTDTDTTNTHENTNNIDNTENITFTPNVDWFNDNPNDFTYDDDSGWYSYNGSNSDYQDTNYKVVSDANGNEYLLSQDPNKNSTDFSDVQNNTAATQSGAGASDIAQQSDLLNMINQNTLSLMTGTASESSFDTSDYENFLTNIGSSIDTLKNSFNDTKSTFENGFTFNSSKYEGYNECVLSKNVFGKDIEINICEPFIPFRNFIIFIITMTMIYKSIIIFMWGIKR
jgi:hypothetical protein